MNRFTHSTHLARWRSGTLTVEDTTVEPHTVETTANHHACASSRTVTCFLVFYVPSPTLRSRYVFVCVCLFSRFKNSTVAARFQETLRVTPTPWAVKLSPFAVPLAVNGRQQQSGEPPTQAVRQLPGLSSCHRLLSHLQ